MYCEQKASERKGGMERMNTTQTATIAGKNMHKLLVAVSLMSVTFCAAPLVRGQAAHKPADKSVNVHAGEDVFVQKCFQCHSVLEGQVRLGPSLYHVAKGPRPKKTPTEIREIVTNGKGKMPPFKEILTQEDTDNLLAYLRSL
jgi:mono/diheme cytochrome c family protein